MKYKPMPALLLSLLFLVSLSKLTNATMWVQKDSCSLSAGCVWYRADNIEWNANYLWLFNQKGSHKGYEEIRGSSYPLYIKFTPSSNTFLQGVILGIYLPWDTTDYAGREVVVELQESTDGGSTWNTVRSKTIAIPDDIPTMTLVKQKGKYMVDFRFDEAYPVSTTNQYRFKIYRIGGAGIWLQLSKDTSHSSWTSDVSDYAFRIIYSNETGTPSPLDVFVITNELIIDKDWSVGYITIPTSPSKDRINSYNNKGSLWIASTGRLYVPSNITTNITVEVKGRMYISAGDRVAWQIGDSEENPIPPDKTVNWFFNCEGTSRRAGIYAYLSSWMKIEHYGSPITHWYAVLKYDANKNTNQIVVEGDVTSEWRVGDKIRIGATKYSSTRHYFDYQRDHTYYEIASLSYNPANNETTITLTSNLAYMHEKGGRVLLIRRNVNIYGDEISATHNRAETYVYWARWWRSYWVRFAYMRYPVYIEWYNPKIPISEYPHTDIFKGILLDNCYYFEVRSRKGGYMEKLATCDSKNSGWSWGEGNYYLYKSRDFIIKDVIGINEYFSIDMSQSSNIDISNFWFQAQYPFYLYLASNCKIHNGIVYNSRYIAFIAGSTENEFYNITAENIYFDSTDSPTETSAQGCFYYSGDMFSQNNYIHDITIRNAFSLISIDIDDGCSDWYDNIFYSGVITEIWQIYRGDWIDQTKIRFTNKNNTENNDWIIYKYGEIHKTGNYTGSDDKTHIDGRFALRFEPKIEGEYFDDYKFRLTDVLHAGDMVTYVGMINVSCDYFAGSDYEMPEIYIEGIDFTKQPTARWVFPNESYCNQWVTFTVSAPANKPGPQYAIIKLKSNANNAYVYIDNDMSIWSGQIDYTSEEVWVNGQPAGPIASFPYGSLAKEVWEYPTNFMKETATIGRMLVEHNGIIYPKDEKVMQNQNITIIFALEKEENYPTYITIIRAKDGLAILNNATMNKIPNTRYYIYNYNFDESGFYIIHIETPYLNMKDTSLVEVIAKQDWWATQSNITALNKSINNIDINNTAIAEAVWSWASRTLTDYNQHEILNLLHDIKDNQVAYFPTWNTTFYYWNNTYFVYWNNSFGDIHSNFNKLWDYWNCSESNAICLYLEAINATTNTSNINSTAIASEVWNYNNRTLTQETLNKTELVNAFNQSEVSKAETYVCIFFLMLGLVFMLIGERTNSFIYYFIGISLLIINIYFAATIPFAVNENGEVIGTSSNIVLIGLNLLFVVIGLVRIFPIVFEYFKR